MNLGELVKDLSLELIAGEIDESRAVSGAYTGDLLSDVMANSKKDNVWITLQTHSNIIAVATLKELSAIIIVLGKNIDDDTAQKAVREKIPVFRTALNAYQASGRLYENGIR